MNDDATMRAGVGDIARRTLLSRPPDAELLAQLKGRTVLDRVDNRVGVVMDVIAGSVHLRPVGGGIEWDRDPKYLADAETGDAS